MRQVSEEEVLAQSFGGGVENKRSAYWLVYVSAETRKKYSKIDQNLYSSTDPTYNIQLHPYGKAMMEKLV